MVSGPSAMNISQMGLELLFTKELRAGEARVGGATRTVVTTGPGALQKLAYRPNTTKSSRTGIFWMHQPEGKAPARA